jgi:hypothetical protein
VHGDARKNGQMKLAANCVMGMAQEIKVFNFPFFATASASLALFMHSSTQVIATVTAFDMADSIDKNGVIFGFFLKNLSASLEKRSISVENLMKPFAAIFFSLAS